MRQLELAAEMAALEAQAMLDGADAADDPLDDADDLLAELDGTDGVRPRPSGSLGRTASEGVVLTDEDMKDPALLAMLERFAGTGAGLEGLEDGGGGGGDPMAMLVQEMHDEAAAAATAAYAGDDWAAVTRHLKAAKELHGELLGLGAEGVEKDTDLAASTKEHLLALKKEAVACNQAGDKPAALVALRKSKALGQALADAGFA